MDIKNKKVVVLAADNYQELELWYPVLRMREAGAKVTIAGEKASHIYRSRLGYEIKTDKEVSGLTVDAIDALIIPGGYAPDTMRINSDIIKLVQALFKQNKCVAAICHAAWVLVSAGILKDKKSTCYHTIRDDVRNAGAHYLDEAVVVDGNLITSRQPDDLPMFCQAIIKQLSYQ